MICIIYFIFNGWICLNNIRKNNEFYQSTLCQIQAIVLHFMFLFYLFIFVLFSVQMNFGTSPFKVTTIGVLSKIFWANHLNLWCVYPEVFFLAKYKCFTQQNFVRHFNLVDFLVLFKKISSFSSLWPLVATQSLASQNYNFSENLDCRIRSIVKKIESSARR